MDDGRFVQETVRRLLRETPVGSSGAGARVRRKFAVATNYSARGVLHAQERHGEDHDPEQKHAQVDALPHADPRRRKVGGDPGCIAESQCPKCREDHQGHDGVEAERTTECRCSEGDRQQHEQNGHACQNEVHGVAGRAPACGQRFAKMHGSERPDEAERAVREDQASHDAQGATASARLPDAPPKGGHEHGVQRARDRPQGSRGSADSRQLADGLRGGAVAFPLPRNEDSHGDIEQGREDSADEQTPS